MEREEPTLGKAPDMSDIEFRPKSYQGPSREIPTARDESWIWKLAVAIGAAVLAALQIFNAFQRHQQRRDAEMVIEAMNAEMAKMAVELEKNPPIRHITIDPDRLLDRSGLAQPRKPLKAGERCIQGRRFERIENGWKQINEPC